MYIDKNLSRKKCLANKVGSLLSRRTEDGWMQNELIEGMNNQEKVKMVNVAIRPDK